MQISWVNHIWFLFLTDGIKFFKNRKYKNEASYSELDQIVASQNLGIILLSHLCDAKSIGER